MSVSFHTGLCEEKSYILLMWAGQSCGLNKSRQAECQCSSLSFSNQCDQLFRTFSTIPPHHEGLYPQTANPNNPFLLHIARVEYFAIAMRKALWIYVVVTSRCGLSLLSQVRRPLPLERSIYTHTPSCMFSWYIRGSMVLIYLYPLATLLCDDPGTLTLGFSIQITLASIPSSQKPFPSSFP